jgi:hypothetical protein
MTSTTTYWQGLVEACKDADNQKNKNIPTKNDVGFTSTENKYHQ